MKLLIVLFCVCVSVLDGRPSADVNHDLKKAAEDAIAAQQFALAIIKQNGNLDEIVEPVIENYYITLMRAAKLLKKLPNGKKYTALAQQALRDIHLILEILDEAGISSSTVIAAVASQWINDFINVLSVIANKLSSRNKVITFDKIKFPKFNTEAIPARRLTQLKAAVISLQYAGNKLLDERHVIEKFAIQHIGVIFNYGQIIINMLTKQTAYGAREFSQGLSQDVKYTEQDALKRIVSIVTTLINNGVQPGDIVVTFVRKAFESFATIINTLAKAP